MPKPFVAVLMGSDSDLPVVQSTLDVLKKLEIPHEVKITSAHRTPEITRIYVQKTDKCGCAVFIAAAGLAAHLAGTVASITFKPVIGIPLDVGGLGGIDSLLSTVQMPGGIPVATVAVGKAGAKNAAYLAAQILALSDSELLKRLTQEHVDNANAVITKNAALQESLQKL